MISDGRPILDACCGSRMFWYDKDNPLVDFQDIRYEECTLQNGQICIVHPNIIGDFTCMNFPDNSYKLVVFDPPHLVHAGNTGIMKKKYGSLDNWKETIKKGFDECMRVLDYYGVLIFKWNETDIKVKTILKTINQTPLFGHKTRTHTIWMAFMKLPTI